MQQTLRAIAVGPAPEVERYAEKVRTYLVTQLVEKALRVYAVDSLLAARGADAPASLDAIPYRPAVTAAELGAADSGRGSTSSPRTQQRYS